MADEYFVGLRSTADLAADEMPESYRAGVLYLYPNGMAPLTGLTALLPSEPLTEGPIYHWWTQSFNPRRAAVTGVYSDTALSSAYVSGGVAGSVLYVKLAAADTKHFRAGHQVLLRLSTDPTLDVNGKVLAVTVNGASSYLVVRLLEADDNSATSTLASADAVMVIGNINEQGGMRPTALSRSPEKFDNYAQIFRTSLDITRTLMKTKLRTEEAYARLKKDALEEHSVEMENGFLWGVKSVNTGDGGKPEYTTDGVVTLIKQHGIVSNYSLDTDYTGKTWLEKGADWIDAKLEEMFRYGSQERLAFCGSGALLGIQRLVKELGFYSIGERTTSFGMKVLEWFTPFGSVTFRTHPLFSYEVTTRNAMLFLEPKNLKYRYIDDTFFKPDNSDRAGGGTGKDGKEEEFLTEAGLEVHFPNTCGYFTGVGVDNTLS